MEQLIAMAQLIFWVSTITVIVLVNKSCKEKRATKQYNAHHEDLKRRGLE